MTLESFLDLLEGVRPAWGYYTARCPAHEDRVQSLSIREGHTRPFVVKCHAGCSYQAIMDALSEGGEGGAVSSGGLTKEPEPRGGERVAPLSESAHPADLSDFSEVYEYVSDVGELLYVVCRAKGKRFFQARPSSKSPTGYVWGRRNGSVLYRLPRVLQAVEDGEDIYVVEGEKDVHAIESLGGVATCNPGGASAQPSTKWLSHFTPVFHGAHVIIVSDVDEVGKAHALYVACQLAEVARDVSLVYPKVGKDAHDHIEAGYGLDDFLERIVA